jgi:hypothetical protein
MTGHPVSESTTLTGASATYAPAWAERRLVGLMVVALSNGPSKAPVTPSMSKKPLSGLLV